MKRRSNNDNNDIPAKKQKRGSITNSFIDEWSTDLSNDPLPIVFRDSIKNKTLEELYDSPRNNYFSTTLYTRKSITNQKQSGTCWLFAGLNVFSYTVINTFKLDSFEFSHSYLFFWDKLEKCNLLLQSFVDDPDNAQLSSLGDGNYWNSFSDLVDKYGLVPKSNMKETLHSLDSKNMNYILHKIVFSTCNKLSKNRYIKNRIKIKKQKMCQIYNILVKFLGQPPTTFNWVYINKYSIIHTVPDLTPITFKNMLSIQLSDYIGLANIPISVTSYNTKYSMKNTKSMVEGSQFTFINISNNMLKNLTMQNIEHGIPVWFTCDVKKGLHKKEGLLNEDSVNTNFFFGDMYNFSKRDKLEFSYIDAGHCMVFIGFNKNENGEITHWQVENSWGDNNNNGYLSMTDKWFDNNVFEIIIHKKILNNNNKILSALNKDPIPIKI
jgi:bleomycin hydrolase